MNRLMSEMQNHAFSWPFREPAKLSDAGYYDLIEQRMGAISFSFHQKLRMIFFRRADLRTLGEKLEAIQYVSLEEFTDDAQLNFDNCRFYNVEDSMWCKHANRLEEAFKESLAHLHDV
jgi:histone acetyltransferase